MWTCFGTIWTSFKFALTVQHELCHLEQVLHVIDGVAGQERHLRFVSVVVHVVDSCWSVLRLGTGTM